MDVRKKTALLAGLALTCTAAVAGTSGAQSQTQTQKSPPPVTAPAPGRPAPGSGSDQAAREPSVHEITGTVKKVDAAGKKVELSSGLFGLLGRTLEVTDDTLIRHEGRPEQLAALREGTRVRAEYESRDGKNIAKSIEVMPAEDERGAAGGAGQPQGQRKTTP
jgi:Cu/Ag efflux protein CusF